ncbi:MAG TPA: UPF0280 family protein, partial [Thermodesulfobacteriota bacterium]|nr:UPF0280 family protein [Thermodesulfobacteriota bacterium]
LHLLKTARREVERYIYHHPVFKTSLTPLPQDLLASPMVQTMLQAAAFCGVGPMAAVAGAIAEHVGKGLLELSPEVIVENGGDIFIQTNETALIEIFAGASPLSQKLALSIKASQMPLGVCTSSGTVGPSLSFGQADAATILSPCATLADAAATAVGNVIHGKQDIPRALEKAQSIPGVSGALIIVGEHLGVWGDVELVSC